MLAMKQKHPTAMAKILQHGIRRVFPSQATKDGEWGPLYDHVVSNAAESYMRARIPARTEIWMDRALEYLVRACFIRRRKIRASYEKALQRVTDATRRTLTPFVERKHVSRLASISRASAVPTGAEKVYDVVATGGGHSGQKHRVNLRAALVGNWRKLCDCESNLSKSGKLA